MNKNRKKIIGTLLGIMASVSSAGAMQNAPSTGSDNTKITNNKNEKQNEFKKRGEAKASRLLQALDLAVRLGLCNEVASTVPGLKRISYPIFRQVFSDYRVVHGFRGYVMRHDNPQYANNVFKLNGDDGHDFRVRVDKGDNLFASGNKPCDTVEIGSSDVIGKIIKKRKFQFSEYLSEQSLSLVTEAKVKNENEFYRLFEAKSIWNIGDVANAVGKANELLDIINNKEMPAEQKNITIEKRFGKNVVFVPTNKNGDEIKLRIFLGKKKFPVIDVEKVLKEKFFAGDIGGDPKNGFENEDNQNYIDPERMELNETLDKLDKTEGLSCYAEFKLVEVK